MTELVLQDCWIPVRDGDDQANRKRGTGQHGQGISESNLGTGLNND